MSETGEAVKMVLVEDELKDSYLNYAMSVIVSRALPDVRDGLKPSQRRILVAMNDLGLSPNAKSRKCAKIAGDTSGNYHPHGEQVVYPTLVRLAQDFSMRYPLIEGQGNFGSIDGDPPAAMRYTEARMSHIAMFMLEDIEKNTVDYTPNYDETREEPKYLPSKFPNLLCNGSSGIAVGMATSIPPHNLREICDSVIALIDKPQITVAELLQIIKGPDFPTGGIICGGNTLRDIYEKGRGLVTVRGRAQIEEVKGGRKNIIFTEIPYNQMKAKIIEQIAQLVKDDKLMGISDIRDESDRTGMRIVIEVKRGEDEDIVLNQLYHTTPLQDTFSIIMIALVNNRPQTLSLKEILEEYLKHRKDVIRRRTRFLLEKAEREAHILEGLSKALDFIDEVIAIIKQSASPREAQAALIERFTFTEIQADAILKMTLQRLTGLEQEKIRRDLDRLHEEIADYHAILANDTLVLDIIREDMFELKEKYGDDRRTEITMEGVKDFVMEELIPDEEMVVVMTHAGYVKRVPLTSYRKQKRGGKGIISAETRETDFIERIFVASAHDYILFFTEKGKVHWKKVYDLPLLSRTSKGKPISVILSLQQGDKVATTIPVKSFETGYLVMATEKGLVKKTELSAYGNPQRGGIIAINLEEGDRLIGVSTTTGEDEVILATRQGQAIRFSEKDLRPMGRATYGVWGIEVEGEDKVVDMVIPQKDATLLSVCENGYGKRTAFDEYRLQSRGGKGVINIKISERNGVVVGMKAVRDDDDLMIITQSAMAVRVPIKGTRVIGRSTQGVRLIRLEEKDKLVSLAVVVSEENGEEGGETPAAPTDIKNGGTENGVAENGSEPTSEESLETGGEASSQS